MTIVDEMVSAREVSVRRSFEFCQECAKLLSSDDKLDNALGRRIIINALDNWAKIPKPTQQIWTSLIESAGFYPYLELEKDRKKIVLNDTAAEIRKEFHQSEHTGKYLHEVQKTHNDILLEGKKNLIVSAPTSFGKSLLIEEVIASKKYQNIVVIQPTLALLDETRKKLMKYKDSYKIIVRTSQKPSLDKRNLFLLTAERVTEYAGLPKIDFFVIDEFYKLSSKRDLERFDVLNNAFNLLVNQYGARFYLLGPNIDNIPPGFKEKFNADFENTDYSLVDVREVDKTSKEFGERGAKKAKKVAALFDLLLQLRNEQTIIYCSSPQSVRELARDFYYYLQTKIEAGTITVQPREALPLVEWIRQTLGDNWSLIKCLSLGIGIHDAALQKHITSSIIQYFNDNKLSFLFCTSTIIEGVNTSAKNVVYFGKKKGLSIPIDYFDYSNIKGRAGRMMVHYVGKVYNFNEPPKSTGIQVDIPFFDQKDVSDEILINIPEKDVLDKASAQYKALMALPQDERELFKRNGISIEGQKTVLEMLKIEIPKNYRLLYWRTIPTFNQLNHVFSLAWNFLKQGESKGGVVTPFALTTVTYKYITWRNIIDVVNDTYEYYKGQRALGDKAVKDSTDEELYDDAIRKTFWIQRHWFYYKVPKWLNVMNSLQEYVCEMKGLPPANYTYLSNKIENDFVRKNLSILVEFGVPQSAITKLANKIPEGLEEDDILAEIKAKNLLEGSNLILYEKQKILENL
jgi:hypothetical protein